MPMDVSISFVRNSCSKSLRSSVLYCWKVEGFFSSTAIYATPMPTVERYSVENSSKSNASFSSNATTLPFAST